MTYTYTHDEMTTATTGELGRGAATKLTQQKLQRPKLHHLGLTCHAQPCHHPKANISKMRRVRTSRQSKLARSSDLL
jgi:hypothetical protein